MNVVTCNINVITHVRWRQPIRCGASSREKREEEEEEEGVNIHTAMERNKTLLQTEEKKHHFSILGVRGGGM